MIWHSARGDGAAVSYCPDSRGCLQVSRRQSLVSQTREGVIIGRKKYSQVESTKPLWEERQLEEERLDRSRPITPM
jgi:hypothetical protein